ncbi:hypothetical protein ACWIG4_27340 [Streptomyces sp. NPDC002248]
MTASSEHAPTFPLQRGCPFSPPQDATAIRESGQPHPVTIWDGSTPWLITRHDHIQQLLGALGKISADVTDPGFPNTSDAQPAVEGSIFFRRDGAEHLPVRRILNPDFTPDAPKRCARASPNSPTSSSTTCSPRPGPSTSSSTSRWPCPPS